VPKEMRSPSVAEDDGNTEELSVNRMCRFSVPASNNMAELLMAKKICPTPCYEPVFLVQEY